MHEPRSTALPLLLILAGLAGCEGDALVRLEGALRVRVINASEQAAFVEVLMAAEDRDDRTAYRSAERPETRIELAKVPTGDWDLFVSTLDGDGEVLQSLQVQSVLIEHDATSEVVVDFAQASVVHIPCQVGDPDIPLCMICVDGEVVAAGDDPRCGVIACDAYSWWSLDGDNGAAGESRCVRGQARDMDSDRCVEPGLCKEASELTCPVTAEVVLSAGLCHSIEGCEAGSPHATTFPDGTPCGTALVCQAGVCVPVEPECRAGDTAPLCMVCENDVWTAAVDDARCGAIDCSAFETWTLEGDNDAAGSSECVHGATAPITADRCAAPNQCVDASAALCPTTDQVAAAAGLCHTIDGCEGGDPQLLTSADETPCGSGLWCQSGQCVPVAQPPDAGCADGQREGFLSLDDYPDIAGCAGGWSVGGVTRADLQATCGRAGGDDGANSEGGGCSAADLCAAGWHVCQGKDEVAQKAPAGCGDAVPPGTPDKALFFAVAQHSTNDSVCDQSQNGNDVFGCGNLGTALVAAKGCAPLDRVLASMSADSCGFNEAEPPLGPWSCIGGVDSHLREGTLVTKDGCAGTSCSYDGYPVGNSDKGGVLCCRD